MAEQLTADQVRDIGRRILARSQLMQEEAMSARAAGAKKPAAFLEGIAAGLRDDALALVRGSRGPDDPPPSNPDDPTPKPEIV